MKMRFISLLLVLVMIAGIMAGYTVAVDAVASGVIYDLADLLEQGKIKPLGRTQAGGAGILGDWSGAGFEMNVSGNGGTMSVGVKTSYACTWAILVDGEQVFWERLTAADESFGVEIPAGNHKITVIKESEMSDNENAYCDLTTLTFGGNIEAAPEYKDVLIEFVGDSYTCGHGTLGVYNPGVIWSALDHSFMHAFPWYTVNALDADYTIAARGGIGLFNGISVEQGTANKKNIAEIYDYTSGFRKSAGLYDFARQPDVVIVEIGANDGISTTDPNKTIEAWKGLLEDLTDQIREKNPNAAIVFLSHRAVKFRAMMQVVEERKETDPNLYAFSFAHQGNGSAAQTTQYAGHPSAEDSESLGKALAAFLVNNGLVRQEGETTGYNDLVYYASENGSDSNNGKTIDTAKSTLYGALTQAKKDNGEFTDDSRVVVYVDGTIHNKSTSTQAFADAGGTLKTASGKNVPVLVTTYNYSGTKAVVDTNHKPGDAYSGIVYFCNDVTMKDIIFQATTNETNGTRDYQIFTGYNQVTFDNVTFAKAGATPIAHEDYNWQISATHIVGTVAAPSEQYTASVTFKNGDYTDIDVAAVRTNKLYNGSVTSSPTVEAKVIVAQGAQMGTVYNRYGTLVVGSSCVEVRGGIIRQYYGTSDGTSSSKKAFSGDVSFVMSSGTVEGISFHSAGSYVTINGDINNTFSGGTMCIRPTVNYDGIFFGGVREVTVNNINNTISGGGFYIIGDVADLDACYYFGGSRNANVKGNVTNKISGGSFVPMNGTQTLKSQLYFGQHSGTIAGTLRNEISAGTFDLGAVATDTIYMATRNPNSPIGKIVNVFGKEGTDQGPVFYGAYLRLSGGYSQVGVSKAAAAEPDVSACTDTVVISNTIYGGLFERNVIAAPSSMTNAASGYYSFVQGSVENNIYDGQLASAFYGAGYANVYGKVTTNIYGGCFSDLYAAGIKSTVYDGVELNIYDLEDNIGILKNPGTFCAASYGVDIPVPQTEGRPSVKLTVAAKNSVIKTPLSVLCKTGTVLGKTEVAVSGGTYPTGFSVAGVAVTEALEEGHMPVDSVGTIIVPTPEMTTTGTLKVSVQKVYYGYTSCAPDAQMGYTTDPNAVDGRPPHSFKDQICTVCGEPENDTVQTHSHTCEHCEATRWVPWDGNTLSLHRGGHFYLTEETAMSGCFNVEAVVNQAVDVTICLNGQTLNGSATSRLFRLSGGAKVTIVDCTAKEVDGVYTAGKVVPQYHKIRGVVAGIFGTGESVFILYDGIIDGGGNNNNSVVSSSAIGGGLIDIATATGKVNLHGGVLKDYNSYYGGAIYCGAGLVTVDGATITDCNATRGRAIMVRGSGAEVIIESGEILGGTQSHGLVAMQNGSRLVLNGGKIGDAAGSNGNGVHISASNCTFEMNGGEISGNSAYGVWVENGTFNFNGGKISGNAYGVVQAAGTFHMTGGEITENTSANEGPGVRVNGGIFHMSGGKIFGNTSTGENSGTGGIRVSGTFHMTGGEVCDNGTPFSASSQIQSADAAAQVSISGTAKVAAGTASKFAVNAFKGAITVSGGNFSGPVAAGSAGTLTITGGMFDTDVSAYVAEGYEQYPNGKVGLPCEHESYKDGFCENCGEAEPGEAYNGLVVVDGVWGYYEGGVLQEDYTGLVPYGDIIFYVENGILDFTYTGLVYYLDEWRYVANSRLTDGYTGLVYFNDNWFYTVNSRIDWTFTGLVPYEGNYFYVQNNLLDWSYTGLGYSDGEWYFIMNGLLQLDFVGLVYFNDTWFYVEDGHLTWDYTGMVEYEGNYFYVQNNVLDWSYTGLGYHDGGWYFIQNALMKKDYYGLVFFNETYFYIEAGELTWKTNGLREHEGKLYYIVDSVVDWSYNGKATYEGVEYDVENGVAKK